MVNVNCIYYENVNKCAHPDRPKFLWFKRTCVEPKYLCCIKEQCLKPTGPFPQAPLTEGKVRGEIIINKCNKKPKSSPPAPQKIKRRARFI